jgi:hypothetical protein
MLVRPHLLYPDVQVTNPRLRIYLYHREEPVQTFGAHSLSPEEVEIGVLNRACDFLGISAIEHRALRFFRAAVEGPGFYLPIRYDVPSLEFTFTPPP